MLQKFCLLSDISCKILARNKMGLKVVNFAVFVFFFFFVLFGFWSYTVLKCITTSKAVISTVIMYK